MRTIVLSLALASSAGVASAQEAVVDPSGPLTAPGFSTIDRLDASSRAGAELSYLFVDADNVSALRFDVHGHYVSPASGFGGYVNLPITYVNTDTVLVDDSNGTIGDIELGGLFVKQLGAQTGLVVRGGLTLPTASNDLQDVLQNLIVGTSRVTDLVLAVPEGMTLRLAVSPTFRSGNVFGRIDVGLDVNLSNATDDAQDPVFRLNAGVGALAGDTVAITGELAVIAPTDDNTDSLSALAVAGRYAKGTVHPYLALVIPLDDDLRDSIDFVATLGVEALLR